MKIPIVDLLAWKLIQFSGLIQWLIFNALTPKHGDILSRVKYIQRAESGRYLSKVRPEDLPTAMRNKLLGMGRVLLLVVVGFTLWDVLG